MSCRGIVRLLRKVSLNLVLIGGGVGLSSLLAILIARHSSIWVGEGFIPTLGPSGLYTTRLLGTAWYLGVSSFLLGGLIWVVTAIVNRQASR
jgi:hypothetical protein